MLKRRARRFLPIIENSNSGGRTLQKLRYELALNLNIDAKIAGRQLEQGRVRILSVVVGLIP